MIHWRSALFVALFVVAEQAGAEAEKSGALASDPKLGLTGTLLVLVAGALGFPPSRLQHLYRLRAYTLLDLGRDSDARQVIDELGATPWLSASWRQNLKQVTGQLDDANWEVRSKLPGGEPIEERLWALREPYLLALAGNRLPAILRAESGLGDDQSGIATTDRLVLTAALEDLEDDGNALISTETDTGLATIVGLRAWLRSRFGVQLPAVKLRDVTLRKASAGVDVDGIHIVDLPAAAARELAEDRSGSPIRTRRRH